MMDDEVDHVSLAVLRTAYERLGIAVEGRPLPAARALAEADAGNSDGEVNRIAEIENAHPELIRIPVAVNVLDGVAFTCRKDVTVPDWESLAPLRVGVRRGVRFAEIGTEHLGGLTIATSYDTLFDMLLHGRLDVVVASRPVGEGQRRRTGSDCIRALKPPLHRTHVYHYLHKRHADLVPELTKVLRRMQADGTLHRIRTEVVRRLVTRSE